MFKALEGLMSSFFSSEEEYETQKKHIFSVLQDNSVDSIIPENNKGLTRRELAEKLPYRWSTVTGRVSDLEDENIIFVNQKRKCSVAEHDREVEEIVAFSHKSPGELE